jgi:hypothetical protein
MSIFFFVLLKIPVSTRQEFVQFSTIIQLTITTIQKIMNRFSFFICMMFLFVCLLGCAQKTPDGMPKLYPTTITITLQGQPLADAGVLLTPVDTENIWVHGSRTNKQGTATILTHGQYNGVPLGKYKLCVSKTLVEGEPPLSDIELAQNPKQHQPPPQKYFHEIPLEYNDSNTTPLELEINVTTNHFTFDIPKRVKIEIPSGGAAR